MSTRQLVFNTNNLVSNGYNNTYTLTIAGGGVNFDNNSISVASINMYNSIFNINANSYKNNTFTLSIPYTSGGVNAYQTLSIALPNGYFAYQDILNYVNNQMILLGAYLVQTNGTYWTGISISANSVYYACEIDLYPIYTAATLPSGWTKPASGLWSGAGLPTTSYTIQMTINSNISSIMGIPQATYPSSLQSTTFTQLSTITPVINPVESLFLRCNLCNNNLLVPQDILYNFTTQNTNFGQLIVVNPPEYQWNNIPKQSTTNITLTIVDQLFRPVLLQDSNLVITLLIRDDNGIN